MTDVAPGHRISVWQWRQDARRNPVIARSRADMAGVYRKVRADNPAIARLLWRRVKTAQSDMTARFNASIIGEAFSE